MHCSGQKISQLKQVTQCSGYLITGNSFPPLGSIWITSAGQTGSQSPQLVHLSRSMSTIIFLFQSEQLGGCFAENPILDFFIEAQVLHGSDIFS